MAASSFTVDASPLAALGVRLAGAGPVIEREFQNSMVRVTAQVQHDAQALVVVDQGHLRRSITTRATPFLGTVGTNLIYARTVERGWPPHYRFIPPGALLNWMQRKGIRPGPHQTIQQVEYRIRRKIWEGGLKARPYLRPALERNRPQIEREFAAAMQRVVARVLA